jgi:hypothetical protein
MNIFGYEVSAWRIYFIIFLICMAAWHYFRSFRVEGFQQSEKMFFDPLVACPAIRNGISSHKSLLEEYIATDAVVSIRGAKHAIELLTESYSDHNCESIPITEVKAPPAPPAPPTPTAK